MKKFLVLFLLVPTLAMSGTFKDDEGKFGLKTKKSGFKFHLNFMDHNDHNFQYIKDKTKARAGKYFQRFELRDGDCFGVGATVTRIEKEWSFQQGQGNLLRKINVMDIV